MAWLTDKQKKKIVADYLELGSYNATAKRNGVSHNTVKRVVRDVPEMDKKVQRKKEQNTADILAYMESKQGLVCEILGKGLDALNSPEKLRDATPAQITTAMGTLIDKWTSVRGALAAAEKNNIFEVIEQSTREEIDTDAIPEIEPPAKPGDDLVEPAGL